MAELVGSFEDASAGSGPLVLLAGEPGIGKSRLVEELGARGARMLVGRCWDAGGEPAYWLWMQALRGYVRTAHDAALGALEERAGDLAQTVPELRERLGDLPPPPLDRRGRAFASLKRRPSFCAAPPTSVRS